jgi:uncharacterized damage-inducible protein DinB
LQEAFMITPGYVRMMAAYNAEMNRRLYTAATRLTDDQRRQERGAFWGSIHGTFSHLLWADRMWLSRFAGSPKPERPLAESARLYQAFAEMSAARERIDAELSAWAETVTAEWLAGDQVWFSGSAGRQMSAPRQTLIVHMFNHQTHHRGQAHAMLTAAGERTGDTDLWLVLPDDKLRPAPAS